MKKTFFIIVILSLPFNIFSQSNFEDKLSESHWSQSTAYRYDNFGRKIVFHKNLTFEIFTLGWNIEPIRGKYKVEGISVFTYPNPESFGPDSLLIQGLEWTIQEKGIASVIYKEQLVSQNGFIFSNTDHYIEPNIERKIEDIPVITIIKNKVILDYNTNVRMGPSLEFEKYTYSFSPDEVLDFLPKGTEVIPLARTEEKQKINGNTSYWYFVEISIHPLTEIGYQFGWIFGSLLDF